MAGVDIVTKEGALSGDVRTEINNAIGKASTAVYIKLPTSDPGIAGCLWNNSGTVTVSAG